MEAILKAPYRFTVGTVSGVLNWGSYLATMGLGMFGIKLMDENKGLLLNRQQAREVNEGDVSPREQDSLAAKAGGEGQKSSVAGIREAVGSANQMLYTAIDGVYGNKHFQEGRQYATQMADSPAVQQVRDVSSSLYKDGYANADAFLSDKTGKKIGDYVEQHGVSVVKFGMYYWTADKLGARESAKFVGKHIELQTESFLGVPDDAIGLFDLPGLVIDSTPYKYSVATVSKLFYAAGYVGGYALDGLEYCGVYKVAASYSAPLIKFVHDHSTYIGAVGAGVLSALYIIDTAALITPLSIVGVAVSGALQVGGGAAILGVSAPFVVAAAVGIGMGLYNDHSVQAHQCGKGLEEYVEHVMGLTHDYEGLLG